MSIKNMTKLDIIINDLLNPTALLIKGFIMASIQLLLRDQKAARKNSILTVRSHRNYTNG